MRKKLPSISCIIGTYNSEKTIFQCLKSIRNQKYPQDKIEILIVDGGSKDRTIKIVKQFNTKIINVDPRKQNAEYNKGVGVAKSRNELLLFLDHDNILPNNNWLSHMVQPIIKEKEIVGVDTLYISYNKSNSLLDRYLALYGSLDPVAYYLGKADKLSYFENINERFPQATKVNGYYKIKFYPFFVPTLGSNGFLSRRKILVENANVKPNYFFHTDVQVDLIIKGYNTFAFVNEKIIHLTGYNNIVGFLKRRYKFMKEFQIKNNTLRRHSVYTSKDRVKLILFIFYALTFAKPLLDAFRGYRRVPDIAWFLHPFLCFSFLVVYGYAIISSKLYEK